MDVSGQGQVLSIEQCPPIADGNGSVVTGRFTTLGASNLVEVSLSDGSVLTGTHSHPVWVPAEAQWVSLAELRAGMFLDSEKEHIFVTNVVLHAKPQDVYNIEVQGEHVYRIGDAAILVHNNNPLCDELLDLKTRKANGETVDESRIAELEKLTAPKWTVNFTKEMLSNSETMFKGSRIHKIEELVEKFGGTKSGWLKKKGWDASGNEWHWYEHHGIGRIGVKPPGFPDPF